MEAHTHLKLFALVLLVALAVGPSLQQAPGVQQAVGQFHEKYGKDSQGSIFDFPYRALSSLNPLAGGLGNIGGRGGGPNTPNAAGGFDFGLSALGNLAGNVFGGQAKGSGGLGIFKKRR